MGNLDWLDNPTEGMVIDYRYRNVKGKITITDIVTEHTGLVRVYFIDEMEGEEPSKDAMYLGSAWNIMFSHVVKVTDVYIINKNPEWEI